MILPYFVIQQSLIIASNKNVFTRLWNTTITIRHLMKICMVQHVLTPCANMFTVITCLLKCKPERMTRPDYTYHRAFLSGWFDVSRDKSTLAESIFRVERPPVKRIRHVSSIQQMLEILCFNVTLSFLWRRLFLGAGFSCTGSSTDCQWAAPVAYFI